MRHDKKKNRKVWPFLTQKKKWTIEAAIESIQMLDLADKDFKVANLNMFLKTKKKNLKKKVC